MKTEAYLTFDGSCREAFEHYARCLGSKAKIETLMTHEGTPMAEHCPPEWRSKILHASLRVGDTLLMASDAPPERYKKPQGFSVSLLADDPAEAERIFAALAEGGTVDMPIQQTFWAPKFGMLTDRFGTPWMISCAP